MKPERRLVNSLDTVNTRTMKFVKKKMKKLLLLTLLCLVNLFNARSQYADSLIFDSSFNSGNSFGTIHEYPDFLRVEYDRLIRKVNDSVFLHFENVENTGILKHRVFGTIIHQNGSITSHLIVNNQVTIFGGAYNYQLITDIVPITAGPLAGSFFLVKNKNTTGTMTEIEIEYFVLNWNNVNPWSLGTSWGTNGRLTISNAKAVRNGKGIWAGLTAPDAVFIYCSIDESNRNLPARYTVVGNNGGGYSLVMLSNSTVTDYYHTIKDVIQLDATNHLIADESYLFNPVNNTVQSSSKIWKVNNLGDSISDFLINWNLNYQPFNQGEVINKLLLDDDKVWVIGGIVTTQPYTEAGRATRYNINDGTIDNTILDGLGTYSNPNYSNGDNSLFFDMVKSPFGSNKYLISGYFRTSAGKTTATVGSLDISSLGTYEYFYEPDPNQETFFRIEGLFPIVAQPAKNSKLIAGTLSSPSNLKAGFQIARFVLNSSGTPSGLEEFKSQSLNIYPNPANDLLNIDVKTDVNIEIMNIYGTVIHRQNLNKGYNTLDIAAFTHGIYLIKSENNSVIKFIKQ